MSEKRTIREEKCLKIANNVLYFDDSSDYCTALWEICAVLGMDDDIAGEKFMEDEE